MNLLFRFIRFLVLSVLQLLFHLLLVFLAIVFRFLLLPLFVLAARACRDLVLLSFSATVYSPARFIDRRAGEWTEHIVGVVEDRAHIHEIYQLCRLLIGAIIVLGWIVASLFTVTIFRVVFAFFT